MAVGVLVVIVLLVLDEVNGVLRELLLLLVLIDVVHGLVEAEHVAAVLLGETGHLLAHVLRLDDLHGQLVQDADVLVLDLAVRGLPLLLLSGRALKDHVLAAQGYPRVLRRRGLSLLQRVAP